ncbi:MAG: hypothetical protein L6308_04095 [Candidatus Omnitrophica bacterium]|nr:hypothetical protein [Candidatus Omnitrophota bacterium]
MNKSILDVNEVKSLYWNEERNLEETAKRLNISMWRLHDFMRENNIPRRSFSEVNYVVNKSRPQFRIKTDLSIAEEKLKIAGIMLYWAEGTSKGNSVDFVNSNPKMIKIFLRFLREICGAKEERLRVYLYGYSYQNVNSLKLYWHNLTKISLKQFTKPFIRKGNPNLSKRKLIYGLVHIRYNDKKLLGIIDNWIKDFVLIWAGTQVAKGDRLCKRSVSLRSEMEK